VGAGLRIGSRATDAPGVDPAPGRPPFFGPGGPVVVGHRGTGPGATPLGYRENTVPAFALAVRRGAAWVECDAQATADGVLVLRHDTAGDGLVVGEHARSALATQALDGLAELHAVLPDDVGVDVEVKVGVPDASGQDPTTAAVVAFVAAHRGERPWLVSSFDPTVVLAARAAGVPAGWLTGEGIGLHESVAAGIRLGAQVACVHAAAVLSTRTTTLPVAGALRLARQHGLALLAWGASARQVPALADTGVGAVCVDDVAGAVSALAAPALPRPRRAAPAASPATSPSTSPSVSLLALPLR